ncbi:MAG TPA: helix-turn-helix transcriptional regulator [Actinomycetota bacterium]|nr:helix-turn-helix transcriptional regulator [Actinomycetota bacterium]
MSFGAQLRDARTAAGMSQADLEQATGIPKSRLSRYENDHILPSVPSLRRLAEALGVTESHLVTPKTDPWTALLTRLRASGLQLRSVKEAESIADSLIATIAERRRREIY